MARDFYKAVNTKDLGMGMVHSAALPFAVVRYQPSNGLITYCVSRHATAAAAKAKATRRNNKEIKRTNAVTRSGKPVNLNETRKVDGGWVGYVMHANGFAVAVFIPEKE